MPNSPRRPRRQRDAWGQAYYDREWARRQFDYALTAPAPHLMSPLTQRIPDECPDVAVVAARR